MSIASCSYLGVLRHPLTEAILVHLVASIRTIHWIGFMVPEVLWWRHTSVIHIYVLLVLNHWNEGNHSFPWSMHSWLWMWRHILHIVVQHEVLHFIMRHSSWILRSHLVLWHRWLSLWLEEWMSKILPYWRQWSRKWVVISSLISQIWRFVRVPSLFIIWGSALWCLTIILQLYLLLTRGRGCRVTWIGIIRCFLLPPLSLLNLFIDFIGPTLIIFPITILDVLIVCFAFFLIPLV